MYMFNLSDTLDNPVTDQAERFPGRQAHSSGIPIGFLTRGSWKITVLWRRRTRHKRQGNHLRGRAPGRRRRGHGCRGGRCQHPEHTRQGVLYLLPDDTLPWKLDPWARPWASVGPDDLRMAMHFQANSEDIRVSFLGFPLLEPAALLDNLLAPVPPALLPLGRLSGSRVRGASDLTGSSGSSGTRTSKTSETA